MNKESRARPLQPPAGERQLFLDDEDIVEIRDLKRRMQRPEKKGTVIRPDCQSLGRDTVYQVRSAPSRDPDEELLRYVVVDTSAETRTNTCWESKDGLNWSPKAMGPDGSNIFGARLPDRETSLYVLIRDDLEEDPARRFKSLYHTGKCLVPAASADLLTWQPFEATPFVSADEWNMSFDQAAHLYIATPKLSGVYGRSVGLATSTDFEHWSESVLTFETDELDQELAPAHIEWYMKNPTLYQEAGAHSSWNWHNVDVYNMGIFRYESLYIGIPALFHRFGPGKEGERPQYAFTFFPLLCSRDLRCWHRVGGRRPFLLPSYMGSGASDLAKSQPPSDAVVRGDELWFYYNGLKYSGWSPKPEDMDADQGAVCLAVLRRDGFVSLEAGEEEGSVTTRLMRPQGSRLFVNVDASGGRLRGAILDAAREPLNGFSTSQCLPIEGDRAGTEVRWEGQGDLAELRGREFRIRFDLQGASLYSYWFE